MNFTIEQFYKLFQGALVFQCLFLVFLYIIARKKDILFYSIYLLLLAIYFFWNAPNTFFNLSDDKIFNSSFYLYANTPLIIVTHLAYIYFLKHFFIDYFQSNRLNIYVRVFTLLAPVLIVISIIFIYTLRSNEYIFYTVNFFSTGISLYILGHIHKNKTKGVQLVVVGMVLNIIGNALTVLMIILSRFNVHHIFIDGYPLFFMRCGILADILLYMIAILQKLNLREKQLAIQQLETQLAIEKVRNELSKELHDDIGSTLSGINMYSHMAKQQMETGNTAASDKTLDIIQQASDEMIYKLKDMVWAMQPGNENMGHLADKIKEYALFITGAKNIALRVDFPADAAGIKLSTEKKHHIYTIAKEALNNAVKYSGARLITIRISFTDNLFVLHIADDGAGFDKKQVTEGNGMLNMQIRAHEIGGDLKLHSTPGNGAELELRLEITREGIV